MKISVLDRMSLGYDTPMEILEQFGEVTVYETTSSEDRVNNIADSDVIVINKVKITDEVMAACPNLKLICVFATGYDNIDVVAAGKRGVAVCNVPSYSTDSVVLFTVATVLSLVSHINEYNTFVKSGEYTKSGIPNRLVPVFHELAGKTWGIIGCGNIGSSVKKVAEALGARVIVYKRTYDERYNCVDLDTLFRESDVITVHCPLNDETRGIINKDKINIMKENVVLVNEARGAVLNENDIADAVKSGRIAAFGCDVYSTEPFGEDHPYYEIKDYNNVLLTPHAAWGAYEARCRCIEIICKNIAAFVNGERLNRVDK